MDIVTGSPLWAKAVALALVYAAVTAAYEWKSFRKKDKVAVVRWSLLALVLAVMAAVWAAHPAPPYGWRLYQLLLVAELGLVGLVAKSLWDEARDG